MELIDMESFDQSTGFRYNPIPNSEFSAILEIYVHHARNIHNICIYQNQDVYAKFSLTYNPDETLSTSIINGGGKNPEFNENLIIKVTQFDAVLKCEIWMLSRAKNFMEDQLLGFALVPLSSVLGKGKLTQDFALSSTDLFHSPAGTVKLTLSLHTNTPFGTNPFPESSSITSEVVLLDRDRNRYRESEVVISDQIEYSRIEFPDMNMLRENQEMVSSFLHLGSTTNLNLPLDNDYEMAANSSDENRACSVSSTMTSLGGDDRNSSNQIITNNNESSLNSVNQSPNACPDTPTSKKGIEIGNINIETEQSEMQKQIVDMYMRSMQQFTESLAKMKLPMNIDNDKTEVDDRGDLIQNNKKESEIDKTAKKKKDGSRVFYGSRAFF